MTQFLRQSTAATVKVGPFVDSTDGDTEETGLTISQADIRLSKNGGAFAQTSNTAGATHDENGWYGVPLSTTDTDTLGRLDLVIHETGALTVHRSYMVLPANVYDALVAGSDNLQVDATQIEGADATNQINAACDTALADYDGPTNAEMVARTLAAASYATAANQATLATALATVDGNVDSILADTGTDGVVVATASKTGYALSDAGIDALFTRALTEAYSTDGGAVTVAQALHEILAMMQEKSISGTTMTVKQRDGSTTALTLTLDDATSPTSITRSG